MPSLGQQWYKVSASINMLKLFSEDVLSLPHLVLSVLGEDAGGTKKGTPSLTKKSVEAFNILRSSLCGGLLLLMMLSQSLAQCGKL